MTSYSYVITRDYGFAPNPFGKHCTLATCKPGIRRGSDIGDWVVALGAKSQNLQGFLVCLMQVTSKLSFNDYWDSPEFAYKKPVMNGSLVQMYGDNIYHQVDGTWKQADSHHSREGGVTNHHNLQRDTSSNHVLVSTNFYYFGQNAIKLPDNIFSSIKIIRGRKIITQNNLDILIQFVSDNCTAGRLGLPMQFRNFSRYDGVS